MTGAGIVYFGNEWYAENRTSSHHIARRLPTCFPVLYVDSPGMRPPKANSRDFRRIVRKLAQTFHKPVKISHNLWHCTIPQLPFRKAPGIGAINRWFGRWALRRAVGSVGFERCISWFVVPHPGFLAGAMNEELVVYYCIDDYAAHPGVDQAAISKADEELTRRADQVFVAPPALVEAKRAQNHTAVYSPHGVDFELFSKAASPDTAVPEPVASLRRPIIGFFGLIADWIDIGLLEYLGRERPDWTFLLIGHISTDVSGLRALSNVVFAGQQPYETLPSWAKAFDVAVMPYRLNRQVKNANPLKLREYLATGKPVVSVPTSEVERFASQVYIAAEPAEFLLAIERALHEDSQERRAARMSAVESMSWDARVADVLDTVSAALLNKRT